MDKDIVPALLELIEKEFDDKVLNSSKVKNALELLQKKQATYINANDFAIEAGEILAGVLGKNITAEILPDGKMYYNIADRILNPTMNKNYELISNYAADMQTELNHNAGFNIKGQKAKLNQDRIDGIVNRVSSEDNFDDIKWILDEPIVNFSQSIVDDTVKENVEFAYKSGIKAKIIRRAESKSCKWCRNLAGTYNYPDEVPENVYRRHENCRCTVEYLPGDGRKQNVHSKKWTDPAEQDKIEARKKIGIKGTQGEYHNTTPAKFSRSLKEAKQHVPEINRWRVEGYGPDHYVGSKLHVTEAGSTAAVTKKGDIISVCRREDDTVRGSDLLAESVKNGGVKLDSFSGNHRFYVKNGFEPVSWCEFDRDFEPEGWNERFDEEPIIFYKYTGKVPDKIETASEFFERVSMSKNYGAAEDVRDKLIGG